MLFRGLYQGRLHVKQKILCLVTSFCCFSNIALADTGVTLTYPISPKDPTNLHGYRVAIWYQPQTWIWSHARIFLNTSFGHWWITSNSPHEQIDIYAVAPTLRYVFKQFNNISPFLDLSIGLSYLSSTYIGDRNLGMHFAFQDQVGIGVTVGKAQNLSASLSALHYSNGSMGRKNAGITIPLLVNFSYRF